MPTRRRFSVPSAPFLLFGAVWLGALGFLAARGEWRWVGWAAVEAAVLGVFVALTVWVTRPSAVTGSEAGDGLAAEPPGEPPATGRARVRAAAQLVAVVALAVLAAARFHEIPVWSRWIGWLYGVAEALPVHRLNDFVNPVLFVALPGAVALALGAGRREIGLGRGRRSWWVSALWAAPVVGLWLHALATGQATVGRIGRAVLTNTVQNGFGEEFLWRGLVQTRIARLWSPEWGLVLAALGFGLWHVGSIADWAATDRGLAAALTLVVQAPMGLALGAVFHRTRNLLAPTVAHVMANTVSV